MAVTSGKIVTTGYNGRVAYFYWERGAVNGTTTTINWEIGTEGNETAGWMSCYYLSFNLNVTKGTSSFSGNHEYITARTQLDPGKVTNGSFTITSNANGESEFTINVTAAIYSSARNKTGSGSFVLPLTITQCGAPTNVNCWGYAKPGGQITVTWGAGSSGVNNPLSFYRVFYRISEDGSKYPQNDEQSDFHENTTGLQTSYTITLPNNISRGYILHFGVMAFGTNTNFASKMTVGGSVTINRLPSAPTSTTQSITIKSTETSFTPRINPGTDADSQTISLRYSTSLAGDYSSWDGRSAIPTSGGTYYFKSYDGLEYSTNAVTVTVTKNTKPVLSLSNAEHLLYKANDVADWSRGMQTKFSTGGKSGTITATCKFGSVTTNLNVPTGTLPSDVKSKVLSSNISISSTQTYSFDVLKTIISEFTNYGDVDEKFPWQIQFTFNDGIENSDVVTWPDTIRCVSPRTSTYNIFNNHSNTNITDRGSTSRFYNQARVRLPINELFDQTLVNVTYANGANNIPVSTETSYDETYQYLNITLPNNIPENTVVSFKASFINTNSGYTNINEFSLTETQKIEITGIDFGRSTVKPFSSESTDIAALTMNWPFLGAENLPTGYTIEAFKTENRNSTSLFAIKSDAFSTSWGKSDSYLSANIKTSILYNFASPDEGTPADFNMTSFSGIKSYYLAIRITNPFGEKFYGWSNELKFDFNEADATAITAISYSEDGESWMPFNKNTEAIQEGVYLKFDAAIQCYTADPNAMVTLFLQRGSSAPINFGTYNTSIPGTTSKNSTTYNTSFIYGPVGEISTDDVRTWSIQTTNNGLMSQVNEGIQTHVLQQSAPTEILITDSEFTDGQTIRFKYSLTHDNDVGAKGYYLMVNDNPTDFSEPDDEGFNVAELGSIGSLDAATIALKIISTITEGESYSSYTAIKDSSKTYYSPNVIVYAITPTIAYRKNYLGINTKEPGIDCVLDIHSTTGKGKVILSGVPNRDGANANSTSLSYDIEKEVITLTENGTDIRTIDLHSGEISDDITIKGKLTVGSMDSLSVTGAASVEGSLGVTGNTNINGTMGVTGKTTLNELEVTGTTTFDDAVLFKKISGIAPFSGSQDTVANWVAKGSGIFYYGQSLLPEQPAAMGFLENVVTTIMADDGERNYCFQTFKRLNANKIYTRYGTPTGWSNSSTVVAGWAGIARDTDLTFNKGNTYTVTGYHFGGSNNSGTTVDAAITLPKPIASDVTSVTISGGLPSWARHETVSYTVTAVGTPTIRATNQITIPCTIAGSAAIKSSVFVVFFGNMDNTNPVKITFN